MICYVLIGVQSQAAYWKTPSHADKLQIFEMYFVELSMTGWLRTEDPNYFCTANCSSGPSCLSTDMQARHTKVSHQAFTNSGSFPISPWTNLLWSSLLLEV